jgi:hypothetical protein
MGDTAKAPFLLTASLTGSEVLPVNRSGSERKTTTQAIADLTVGPFPNEAGGTTFALSGAYTVFKPYSTATGGALGRNFMFGYWWSPGRARTLSTLGAWVNVGVATSAARVALYNVGPDGYPTTLVGYSNEISGATGGLATASVVGGSIAASQRTNYFVALLSGGGADPNLSTFSTSGPTYFIASTTPANPRIGLIVAQTYGVPPATFPAGASASQHFHAPVMFYD